MKKYTSNEKASWGKNTKAQRSAEPHIDYTQRQHISSSSSSSNWSKVGEVPASSLVIWFTCRVQYAFSFTRCIIFIVLIIENTSCYNEIVVHGILYTFLSLPYYSSITLNNFSLDDSYSWRLKRNKINNTYTPLIS